MDEPLTLAWRAPSPSQRCAPGPALSRQERARDFFLRDHLGISWRVVCTIVAVGLIINKITFAKLRFGILAVLLTVLWSDLTYAQSPWMGYALAQKRLAVAGFTDCYRSQSSHKKAYAGRNLTDAVRLIDESAKSGDVSLPSLIIQSIQKAPIVRPDPHEEYWNGPTGFHSGLWWRGIEDSERQAYVQGVVWCSQAPGVSVQISNTSSQAIVLKLNDWYVVMDDDWKDPRSNARVDVPVISALQKVEILYIK